MDSLFDPLIAVGRNTALKYLYGLATLIEFEAFRESLAPDIFQRTDSLREE
jgi:hypothetical protein